MQCNREIVDSNLTTSSVQGHMKKSKARECSKKKVSRLSQILSSHMQMENHFMSQTTSSNRHCFQEAI